MNNEKLLQEIQLLKQENDIFKKKINNLEKANREKRGPFSKVNLFFGVFISALITSMVLYAAQITFTEGTVISASEMNSNFTELYTMVNDLKSTFAGVSRDGDNIVFTGVNVQIVNGTYSGTKNGLGNLIIGYNTLRNDNPALGSEKYYHDDRSGSHNLVIGSLLNYSSTGGIVTGFMNTISGESSSIIGGSWNIASETLSTIIGGHMNTAMGESSTITGGAYNTVSGKYSSITGGSSNFVNAYAATVSGGNNNDATYDFSTVSGGLNRSSNVINQWRGGGYYSNELAY